MKTRTTAKHINTPDDGRGMRTVLLNGNPIARAFYADTRRGIVRAYRFPYRLDKWKKRLLHITMRGLVTVKLSRENS